MFEKPLGLRENPFLAGHHPKYLFPSREHQEALAHLRYGIQNREPFVLITGEVGTGKTTAVYDALAEWGSRAMVALITNSALTRSELLEEICLRFGVAVNAPLSKPHALVELQKQLSAVRERGELAILLVDEAQNLDRELLEEIRLLSNLEVNGEYLLQIFLVGQPELEAKLAQKELRQLRQRIGIHYRILPLSGAETARYIHHRVSVAGGNAEELFPNDTCVEIFRITNGIPREINIVAGQSLLNAFVEDSRSVTIAHVRAVEREIEFQSVLRHQSAVTANPADAGSEAKPRKAGPATIHPIAPPQPVGETPRETPAPPLEDLAGETATENEMDDEVTETAFGESLSETDDAIEDEYSGIGEGRVVDDEIEETPDTRSGRGEDELVLPSWIDEIVARRKMAEEQTAAAPPAAWQPAAMTPPPPPMIEPPVVIEASEDYRRASEFERPDDYGRTSDIEYPAHPSGAMLAAPAPERIVPQPADPIPIFGRNDDALPPRLRNKLADEEESPTGRRASRAWPIASLVIAAIAIAVLLVVRFSPWSAPRSGTVPAGANAPEGAVEAAPDTMGLFPPLNGLGAPGATNVQTTEPIPAPSPAAGAGEPLGAPGLAVGEPTPADTVRPPVPMQSFTIAVGTYLNEGRANAEKTRLGESTKLDTRVVTMAEDAVSMNRGLVGSYGDRSSAERAASDLVQRGLVLEARVVTVSKRR